MNIVTICAWCFFCYAQIFFYHTKKNTKKPHPKEVTVLQTLKDATTVTNKPSTYRFIIEKPVSDMLNSNSMPRNTFLKSKRASALRELGQQLGVQQHPTPDIAQQYLEYNHQVSKTKQLKSKATKKFNNGTLAQEPYQALIQQYENNLKNISKPNIAYPLTTFTVKVYVTHPDRRQIDPANLYPTIKPFLDGLTDSGWWEDDSLQYLLSIEFQYGGVSPTKNQIIILDITECDPTPYITTYQPANMQPHQHP